MFPHTRILPACARRLAAITLILNLLVIASGVNSARGDDRLWKNAVSGSFADTNRWVGGLVPGNADRAVFAVNGTYNVNFLIGRVNNQLLVGQDNPTFNLLTNTYSLTGATEGVVIGGTTNGANLTLNNGTLRSFDLIIGRDPNLGGQLIVNSNALYEALDDATIGDQSIGTVNAAGDFKVTDNLIVGNQAGAAGSSLTVDGTDSELNVGGTFSVGKGADASFTLQNQATAHTVNTAIGREADITGTALVDGGAEWTNTGILVVGENGHGTLDVSNGATVSTAQLFIAGAADSTGEVTIAGFPSRIDATTQIDIGGAFSADGGTGHLTVKDGAHVTAGASGATVFAAGTLTLETGGNFEGTVNNFGRVEGNGNLGADGDLLQNYGVVAPGLSAGSLIVLGDLVQTPDVVQGTGVLEIELGGLNPGVQSDLLQVHGTATLGGTLLVSLLPGFVPMLNDEFLILISQRAGGVVNTFDDEILPALSGGLAWDVLYGSEDVRLKVVQVPEPSTLVLAIVGACGLAVLARRRYK